METKIPAKDFSDDPDKTTASSANVKMDTEKNEIKIIHTKKKGTCKNCDGLCCQKKQVTENHKTNDDGSDISS